MEIQSVNHRLPSNQRYQKECFNDGDSLNYLINMFLPKTEFTQWYCSKIYHPNKTDTIDFTYAKYGEFDKLPQFTSTYHRSRISNFFFGGNKSQGLEKSHERIVLQKISSSTERLVLNYDYVDSSEIPQNSAIVHPDDSEINILDSLYVSTSAKKWSFNGQSGEDLDEWYRYIHGKSSMYNTACNMTGIIRETNPYIITDSGTPSVNIYSRELVEDINEINNPFGYASFNSLEDINQYQDLYQGGFLESTNLHYSNLTFGDIYRINANFSGAAQPSLFDISVVTGYKPITDHANFFYDGPNNLEIHSDCYEYGMNQFLASTFSSPLKHIVSSSYDSVSYFFNLQTFSIFDFEDIRIQIGPSNSDTKFDYNLCENNDVDPANNPISFKSYFNIIYDGAFDDPDDITFKEMNSGAYVKSNYGIGAPWYLLNNYFSDAGLNLYTNILNPSQASNTIGSTWWSDEAYSSLCDPFCREYPSNPLLTPASTRLIDVELERISELPFVLVSAQKEIHNTDSSWAIISKYGFNYAIETLQNSAYYNTYDFANEGNTTVNSRASGGRYLLLLKKIKRLPNTSNSTFDNTPTDYQTYHFEYDKKTYSVLSWYSKSFHNEFMVLNSVTNPLGLKKQIHYYHPDYLPIELSFSSIISSNGFDADDISQIQQGADLKSYIQLNQIKTTPFIYNTILSSSTPSCRGDSTIRIDNGLSYTIYMAVDSVLSDQGYTTNIVDYNYDTLISKLENETLSQEFLWDFIDQPYRTGYKEVEVIQPEFNNLKPKEVYLYSDNQLSFGKIVSHKQYDGNDNLIINKTFMYDTIRIAELDWENESSIDHPDFATTNRMYDVPYFYETRYPNIYWNSSHFLKLIEDTQAHYIGSDSIKTNRTYEYFDCNFNLISSSEGIDTLLGTSTLTHYPSFNLYRTVTSSSNFPSVSISKENFYLIDLINSDGMLPTEVTLSFNSNRRDLVFQSRSYFERDTNNHVMTSLNEFYDTNLLLKAKYKSIQPIWDVGLIYSNGSLLKTNEVASYDIQLQLPLETEDVKEMKTTNTYYSNGFLESTTTSSSDNTLNTYEQEYFYDAQTALLDSINDENDIVFTFDYDDRARLISTKRNGNVLTHTLYSNWDNDTIQTADLPLCANTHLYSGYINQNFTRTKEYFADTLNSVTHQFIDPYGREVMMSKDSLYRFSNVIYDPYGRIIESFDQEECVGYESDFLEDADNRNFEYYDYPQTFLKRASKKGNDISTTYSEFIHTIVSDSDITTALTSAGNSATDYILQGDYYKVRATDEDGKYVDSYKDFLGNEVATILGNGVAGTAFHYDARNLLLEITNGENQVSEFEYNYLGQQYYKGSVDCGDEYFAYDHVGNNVYHETGISKQINVFDGYGRLIETGASDVSATTFLANQGLPWISSQNSYLEFHNANTPEIDSFYTKMFYDEVNNNYPIANQFSDELSLYNYSQNKLRQAISFNELGTPVQNVAFGYDDNGFKVFKGVHIDKTDILTGLDSIIYQCNVSYGRNNLPFEEQVNLKADDTLEYAYKYSYDERFRISEIFIPTSYPGMSPNYSQIGKLNYNDENDLLISKYLFKIDLPESDSCTLLSVVDSTIYLYDTQDRLTNIQGIHYNEILYYDTNQPPEVTSSQNFNGNINGLKHSTPVIDSTNFSYDERYEGFQYDNFNRITQSDSKLSLTCDPNVLGCFHDDPWPTQLGDVEYSYDKIGNLVSIERIVATDQNNNVESEDIFFNFISGTNKIISIDENPNSLVLDPLQPFSYDPYGNMLGDGYNGGQSEEFDRNNLPITFIKDSTLTKYLYDHTGMRIYKSTYDSLTMDTTSQFYLKDIFGRTISIINDNHQVFEWNVFGNDMLASIEALDFCSENDSLILTGKEMSDRIYYARYISSTKNIFPADDITYIATDSIVLDSLFAGFEIPLGHSLVIDTVDFNCDSIPQRFKVRYYSLDHLGNVRVKFHNECSSDTTGAVFPYIVYDNIYDYFPFGRILFYQNEMGEGRYQYSSKERDSESGYDYFGARSYSSTLGRFNNVDPKANNYKSWSPYNYTLNNPIRLVDPDGNEPKDIIVGGIIWTPGSLGTGESDFVKQTFAALNKLVSEPSAGLVKGQGVTGHAILDFVGDNAIGDVEIIQGPGLNSFHETNEQGTKINFSENIGLYIQADNSVSGNSGAISPATLLGHEFGHAWLAQRNPELNAIFESADNRSFNLGKDSPIEHGWINLLEQKIANSLGETGRISIRSAAINKESSVSPSGLFPDSDYFFKTVNSISNKPE